MQACHVSAAEETLGANSVWLNMMLTSNWSTHPRDAVLKMWTDVTWSCSGFQAADRAVQFVNLMTNVYTNAQVLTIVSRTCATMASTLQYDLKSTYCPHMLCASSSPCFDVMCMSVELSHYCHARFIQLVPNQQSFGHMQVSITFRLCSGSVTTSCDVCSGSVTTSCDVCSGSVTTSCDVWSGWVSYIMSAKVLS